MVAPQWKPIACLDKTFALRGTARRDTPSVKDGHKPNLTVQQAGASTVGTATEDVRKVATTVEKPRARAPGKAQERVAAKNLTSSEQSRQRMGIPRHCVLISGRQADDKSEGACQEIADN